MDPDVYKPEIIRFVCQTGNNHRDTIWEYCRGAFGELCSPQAFHQACDVLQIPPTQEESNQAV